jgi:3-methyladenine DNA glycosylase/8-oxoguanine DNA glycosylase
VSELEIEPTAPYDLVRSARGGDGITQRLDGATVAFGLRDGAQAHVRQSADGRLRVRLQGPDVAAAEQELRDRLGCDAPIDGFIAIARADPLLAPLLRRCPGLRALRTGTIAHAALRAFAGQLITFREAQQIERRIVRLAVPPPAVDALVASPTAAQLLALGTARLVACGLAQRRADALMRLLRTVDLERLRDHEPERVAARLTRESQIGPWTIGVIGLHGYGWEDHGLVGDLGLMRLAAAQLGRDATVADTAAVLAPYAPWRGLASMHLLGHPLARAPRR